MHLLSGGLQKNEQGAAVAVPTRKDMRAFLSSLQSQNIVGTSGVLFRDQEAALAFRNPAKYLGEVDSFVTFHEV